MTKKTITYNGLELSEEWVQEIKDAQKIKTFIIDGKECKRVAYGDEEEDWGADSGPCHDCSVIKGQLHLTSCDAERCPVCGGQALGCECKYEGDEDDKDE